MTDNRPPDRGRGRENYPGSKSARKNLFGRDQNVDHHLTREMDEMQQREQERFKEKWNYDIASDTKLPGKFDWGDPVPLETQSSLLHVPATENRPQGDNGSKPGCSAGDAVDPLSPSTSQSGKQSPKSAGDSAPKRTRSPSPEGEDQPSAKSPRR